MSQPAALEASAVLVGTGRMARAHAQALARLGIALHAVCDTRADVCDAFGAEFGVPPARRFRDAAVMFAGVGGPGLAIIASTADAHQGLTCFAARGGARRILCEKPMATSLAACDAMVAACHEVGALLAINHQMRFMDQYNLIKQEFASGRFGTLSSMNVVGGCFGLAMNGCHYVEAFGHLAGSDPVEVSAWLSPEPIASPRGAQFFDRAGTIRAVAEGGQRLTLSCDADQGHGMTVTYAATLGHIFVDELEGEYIATARKPEHGAAPASRYGMPWDRWQRRFPPADNVGPTAAVIEALMAGRGYPSGADGRRAVATLVAAHRSDEAGHTPVRLDALGGDAGRVFPWA